MVEYLQDASRRYIKRGVYVIRYREVFLDEKEYYKGRFWNLNEPTADAIYSDYIKCFCFEDYPLCIIYDLLK